jgi:hypothetical protein
MCWNLWVVDAFLHTCCPRQQILSWEYARRTLELGAFRRCSQRCSLVHYRVTSCRLSTRDLDSTKFFDVGFESQTLLEYAKERGLFQVAIIGQPEEAQRRPAGLISIFVSLPGLAYSSPKRQHQTYISSTS